MSQLAVFCFCTLLVSVNPEIRQRRTLHSLSSSAETSIKVGEEQCDAAKIKANIEQIFSVSSQLVVRLSSDVGALVKDLLICVDPLTIGFCLGYVYPSVVLGYMVDAARAVLSYLITVPALAAQTAKDIVTCAV